MYRLIIRQTGSGFYSSPSRQARSLFLTSNSRNSDEFRPSEDLAKERYDMRANEDIAKKRARLLYQSRKRGMLENGVILASFADRYLNDLDPDQLDQYDRLINLPTNDWDIFYWATKTKPTPPEFETSIMEKLRLHLNKKVSKSDDEIPRKEPTSILHGKNPRDIVIPKIKKNYPLDIDPHEMDLVEYRKELFDPRKKSFGGGKSIEFMTDWRKRFFERRLRRVISSPVSVRNLDENKDSPVYTQKVEKIKIAKTNLESNDLIDSENDRNMKHHNFVQYLLSHGFTDRLDEYEWEAEAWSNTLWIRNYGKSDVTVAPSQIQCKSCRAKLHCCDPGLDGYLPKQLFAKLFDENKSSETLCQRCKFSKIYGVSLSAAVSEPEYMELLRNISKMKPSVICLLVDLTDFPNSIMENIIEQIGSRHRIIIVGNKIDLLPIDGPDMIKRVSLCLEKNLTKFRPGNSNMNISATIVLSARTGFGIEALVSKLLELTENPKDVYLLGCDNTGKSTLFNALLQSDLAAVRDVDLLSRVSEDNGSQTSVKMLKFPINRAEGWEIELKKRRTRIVDRNSVRLEKRFKSTTTCRQADTPHMSMLIDRVEYPSSDEGIIIHNPQTHTNFSDDHPFQKIKQQNIFSASEENLKGHSFFRQTPSIVNRDQLHDLLTNDERLEVFPHETIVPRKYVIRPLQSVFIAGLARLDLLTATSAVKVTIFTSRYLPIHVIATRKADKFYRTFLGSSYLGVPFGDEDRLKRWPGLVSSKKDYNICGVEDVVLGSAAWALIEVGIDQECIVRGWTPEARGIVKRSPPLLRFGGNIKGKKIRDTPLFIHPDFKIDQVLIPVAQ